MLSEVKKGAIILLAPSTGGKDTVLSHISADGLVKQCRRDTTRPALPNEIGLYCHIVAEEFQSRLKRGDYLLPDSYAGYFYGVPVEQVSEVWENRQIPVLKGPLTGVAATKMRLESLGADSNAVVAIYLFPSDEVVWRQMLLSRGFSNAQQRIEVSLEEMGAARDGSGHLIDVPIVNVFGRLEETVEQLRQTIVSRFLS